MNIGIVSDLHGNLVGWQRAMELLADCQLLLCPGDLLYHGPRFDPVENYNPRALAEAINNCGVPIIIARGNADSEVDSLFVHQPIQSPYALAVVEGKRFLVTHGHLDPPAKLLELAQTWAIDFLVNGHFHSPHITVHDSLIHLNPGTPTYPMAEEEALRRPTCARIVNGVPEVLDLLSGDVLQLP